MMKIIAPFDRESEIKRHDLINFIEENISSDALLINNTTRALEVNLDSILNDFKNFVQSFVFILTLDGKYEESYDINDKYTCAVEFKKVNSFVLHNSLFELMLLYLKNSESISFADFVNKSSLIKLALLKKSSTNRQNYRINAIIPFRNCEKYILDCCYSILKQEYSHYRVFLIDDLSSDKSEEIIIKNIKDKRFFYIKRGERNFALQNIIKVLVDKDLKFSNTDIICIIDGDDMLNSPFVFSIINQVYSKRNCLVTYGSFIRFDTQNLTTFCLRYSKDEFRTLRKSKWKASHLKTWKFEIFKEYWKQDPSFSSLKNAKGEFYDMTYDMAIMFPLLEIAGYENTFGINIPIYLYRLHELNDHMVNAFNQFSIENEIRGKVPYVQYC